VKALFKPTSSVLRRWAGADLLVAYSLLRVMSGNSN
jgi:hypothetical protein